MSEDKTPKIRVLIRKRPMNKKQLSRGQTDIITVQNNQTVVVREQKVKVDLTPFVDQHRLNFDGAYDQTASNQQIYATSIRPLVDCAFDGAKVSCFAYGQTGSGKTHTMLGNGSDVRGLYLLAAIDIFQQLDAYPDIDVWISFYEIYCGKLFDLLNEKNILHARQDAKSNVNIVGLSETKLQGAQNLMQIIDYGMGARVTSQNGTNNDSSRSHAILQISLKKKNKTHGKITFIDLAGSERAADHADQLQKQTRIDGAEINKSLLALKECIRALDQNKNHTPFRGSKLTMVLKDSFTGYCRTVMIGNISPNSSSSQNTLNTLKYADRVKELKKPNKENFMQMEKIDQLEKELMLPRNINRKPKNVQQQGFNNGNNNNNNRRQDEDYREFRENINANLIEQPSSNHYQKLKMGVLQNKEKRFNNNNNGNNNMGNMSQNNNSNNGMMRRNSPQIIGNNNNNYSNNQNNNNQNYNNNNSNHNGFNYHNGNNYLMKKSPMKDQSPQYRHGNMGKPVPVLVQQNEPIQPATQADLQRLADAKEQKVQIILEQEEILLKGHQDHINHTIQLTKRQMLIKADADKIGSRIQDYLDNLNSTLDEKLESIFSLKEKIQNIRGHLQEHKNIQNQYSRNLNQLVQQRDDHLGDDQNLLLDDGDDNDKLFN